MERTLLPGTDLEVSRLGFGTAAFGLSISSKAASQLLARAFDSGITHFDTARAYGYGRAERHLGRFIRDKRDQVTITTKAGIWPDPIAAGLSRHVLGASRPRLLRSRRNDKERFKPELLRSSLERSLRMLETDYVDLLLLHECAANEVRDDVLGFLETCVKKGLTRYAGIATDKQQSMSILARDTAFPAVCQVACDPVWTVPPDLEAPTPRERAFILHSAVNNGLRLLRGLARQPETDSQLTRLLENEDLGAVILRRTVERIGNGCVIFASVNLEHISNNASYASERLEENAASLGSLLKRYALGSAD